MSALDNPIAEARETVRANLRHRETDALLLARKRLDRRTDFGDLHEVAAHMGAVLALADELEERGVAV